MSSTFMLKLLWLKNFNQFFSNFYFFYFQSFFIFNVTGMKFQSRLKSKPTVTALVTSVIFYHCSRVSERTSIKERKKESEMFMIAMMIIFIKREHKKVQVKIHVRNIKIFFYCWKCKFFSRSLIILITIYLFKVDELSESCLVMVTQFLFNFAFHAALLVAQRWLVNPLLLMLITGINLSIFTTPNYQ